MEGGLNQLARSGDLAGVLRLLDSGVPVDFIENGRFSDSPLMEAARGGHLEVMQLLLDRGADVNHSDNDSFTPVTAAGDSEQPAGDSLNQWREPAKDLQTLGAGNGGNSWTHVSH